MSGLIGFSDLFADSWHLVLIGSAVLSLFGFVLWAYAARRDMSSGGF